MDATENEGRIVYGSAVARPASGLFGEKGRESVVLPDTPNPSMRGQLLDAFIGFAEAQPEADFSVGRPLNRPMVALMLYGRGAIMEQQLRSLAGQVVDLADRLRPILGQEE